MNKKFIIISLVVVGLLLVSSYLVTAPWGAEADEHPRSAIGQFLFGDRDEEVKPVPTPPVVMTDEQIKCFIDLTPPFMSAAPPPYECLALILLSIEGLTDDWNFPIFEDWVQDTPFLYTYNIDGTTVTDGDAYLLEMLASFMVYYNNTYAPEPLLEVYNLFIANDAGEVPVPFTVFIQLLGQTVGVEGRTIPVTIEALRQVKIEVETPKDACLNIEDIQTTVPKGLFQDGNGDCICDACRNIEGVQTFVPGFLTRDKEGNCDCGKVRGAAGTATDATATQEQEAIEIGG